MANRHITMMVWSVTSDGESNRLNITKEVAQYRLQIADELLQALIASGMDEDEAYAAVAENMAGNMDEYNRIVGEVAEDISVNMDKAAVNMATSVKVNAAASHESFKALMGTVWELADAIKGAANGVRSGTSTIFNGGKPVESGGITADKHSGSFNRSEIDFSSNNFDLDDFQSQLELDIKGYTDAISNIDAQIEILRNLQTSFDRDKHGGIGGHGYADRIKELEKEKSEINDAIKDATGNAKKGTESTKDEFSETIDFFERRLEVLNQAVSFLKAGMDNVNGAFAKNSLVDAQLGITEDKFNGYANAMAMYTKKADEALSKLPTDIAAKVRDGAVELTDFIGDGNKDVVEAIKEYEEWADKVADCKQNLEELRTEIRQLELDKFNNVMEDFNDQFNLRDDNKDLISKQIDLLKEAGELIGESFYKAQIDQSQKQLALLENEKAQLVDQMSSAISSGRVQKGTNEWLEMVNALSEVEGNILDCKKSIEEFDNELLNLHTEVFNRIQDRFSDLGSEISNIIGLFDDTEVSDDKGIWSKEGITQLGLLAQQYELAQHQVEQYGDEIDELNAQYLAGRYSATEYADRLADLNSAQWDAVDSAESAKDAIMDLNEARVENAVKGIEKEIDAYKELIDAQIDALGKEKELHDYKQSIADKNKAVADIERQIAAMQYDTSASGIARRKKLEEQLVEAKKALEETEYEHSIQAQEDALNKQYENYEEKRQQEITNLKASLTDKETILSESFQTVKDNADIVGQEIASMAVNHGIAVSDALISSWKSGERAIASYGEALSQNTSAFIGNIIGVEDEVWNLQAQADSTAQSLAWMFSTRADRLVEELAQSYHAESNLANMTNALQQSLVNALERGYNVSGIVNSLNSITTAANEAADAIRKVESNRMPTPTDTSHKATSPQATKPSAPFKSTGKASSTKKPLSGTGGGQSSDPRKFANLKDSFYSEGTRSSHGGIIVKDEEGYEMELPKLSSGRYAIANEGSQILTKEQTDNMFDWSSINPSEIFSIDSIEALWGNARMKMPTIDRRMSAPVNVHYDSMFAFNGDVIDADRAIKQMEKVALKITDQRIDKSWREFSDELRYG